MKKQHFSHLDQNGQARMVDVGDKPITQREAMAKGSIRVNPQIIRLIQESQVPKGDVFATARIAGIMAAKKVDSLIPLCHSLKVNFVHISFDVKTVNIKITSHVKSEGKTGVEMEALTAVSIAALTIYDMCKAVDKGMVIGPIYLTKKSGGRSGSYVRQEIPK